MDPGFLLLVIILVVVCSIGWSAENRRQERARKTREERERLGLGPTILPPVGSEDDDDPMSYWGM